MKRTWMLLTAVAFLLPILVQAQSLSYEDDLYYNPTKAKVITGQNNASKSTAGVANPTVQTENGNVQIYDNSGTLKIRDVDEYNRHVSMDNSDLLAINENETVASEGNGDELSTEAPYEYSERVRRFNDPKFTKQVTDDGYLNIYIQDSSKVNVYYIDGGSNGFMSPDYYDSYYYGNGWRNWSPYYSYYYDPWFSSWGFYDSWYGGYGGYYGYEPYCGWDCYGGGGAYVYSGGGNNRHHLSSDQRNFLLNNRTGFSQGRTAGSITTRSGSATTHSGSGSVITRSGVSSRNGNYSIARSTGTYSRSISNGYVVRSTTSGQPTYYRVVTRPASNSYSVSRTENGSNSVSRGTSSSYSRSSSNSSSSTVNTVRSSSSTSSSSSSSYSAPASSSSGSYSGGGGGGGSRSSGGGHGGRR
jgi:hypothetical protein